MKPWLSFLAVTLTGFISSGYRSASLGDREVIVALVPKGSVERYYNRLATETHHLVVTDYMPTEANTAYRVKLSANEELFIVEPHAGATSSVPGEIVRLDRFVLAKLWKFAESEHVHLGDVENYVERISPEITELTQRPDRKNKNAFALAVKQGLELDIDTDFLRVALEEFSGARPVEIDNAEVTIKERGSKAGRANAVAWLTAQYAALGYTVSNHSYRGGTNFVAERPGSDPSKTVIVSAHLDSMSNAGADDDGSGIVSALAIAKSLSNYELKYNLRIIGFDQEELGLIGSAHYTAKLNDENSLENIVGVFNIEMTGYDADNDGHMHIIDCNENTSAELSTLVSDAIDTYGIELTKVDACTNRSDHASFWRYDIPAVVVSQNFFGGDSNPCYHRACDKIDRINWDYMTKLTKALAYGVASAVVEDKAPL